MHADLAANADERASLRRLVAAMSAALLASKTPHGIDDGSANDVVTTCSEVTTVAEASQVHGSENARLRKRIDELDELVASLLHQVCFKF